MYVTSCRIAYHLQRCPLSGQSIHVLSDRAYKVCVCHHPPYTIGTSPEPRVFLYYVYAKCSSCMKCRRKFRRRFPCAPTMSTTKAINNFVKSFRATCSIPDSKRACRQHVLKKKTRRNWLLTGDISTERNGSARTTDGCVWIISTQSNNRTSALACHKTASFQSPDLNPHERFFFLEASWKTKCVAIILVLMV